MNSPASNTTIPRPEKPQADSGTDYAPFGQTTLLAIQLALVFVYLASTGYRTLVSRHVVTTFEIVQNAVGIGLFILWQVVMAPPGKQRLLAGVICFLVAKSSYAAAILLARKGAQRNSAVYGIVGLALQIAALLIVVPAGPRLVAWCGLALATAQLGKREHTTQACGYRRPCTFSQRLWLRAWSGYRSNTLPP